MPGMTYQTASHAIAIPDGNAPEWIQLLPAGKFSGRDGRGPYVTDAASIIRWFDRWGERVIDYEHPEDRHGRPAPAAGWFRTAEWREGEGLFAVDVEWTPKAAAMIAAGEYRYISPVFEYAPKAGAVEALHMAALTNNPGLSGMQAVALSAALARLTSLERKNPMDELLKKLRAALGLADDQDGDAALTAVAALKTKTDETERSLAELKAKADEASANVATLTAKLAAKQEQEPDPAKFAPLSVVSELQNQVAALTAARDKTTVDTLFKAARDDGKVISAEYEAHLRTIPVAALKGVLDGLVPLAALKGMQSDSIATGKDGKPAPAAHDLAVMKALGLSANEYAKGKE
jgi:phage I-like protein